MYIGFSTTSTGIQKIQVSNPTVHQQVVAGPYRDYALGDDGNLYYMNSTNLMMVALTAVAKVEQLINTIGTVTPESEEAITAARNAYIALSAEDRAKVTNLQTLETAEATLAEMKDPVVMVEHLINAIGTVTSESGAAITAARNAYNALSAEDQAKVTNLQTLEDAEAVFAALTPTTKVEANYPFAYIPPLELPEGAAFVSLTANPIATLADAYENKTINSAYIGKAEGTAVPNQTQDAFMCNAKYGQWVAFKLRSPGTGEYDITLNFTINSNNTRECSVYILPGDTSLTDIESALASAQAVGTANLQDKALAAELGSYKRESI